MAFTDMLGQYVDNRFQGASDRLGQAYGLMTGDENSWNQQLGINETEEERKKRLRREAQARGEILPDEVVDTTTTKTYADGSQTETTRREIPAPPAPQAAPVMEPQQPLDQATVEIPPAPPAPQRSMAEQAYEDEMARRGQAPQAAPAPQPQMAAPAPQPVAPVAPAPQPQMAAPAPQPVAPVAPQAAMAPPQLPPMPQPGPGVQVAGPAQMPPAAPAPLPRVEVAPTPTIPTVQATAAPAAPVAEARTYMDDVADISQDPAKLFEYAGRKDVPAEGRLMAAKLAKQHIRQIEDQQRASEVIRKVQETGDSTDLERIMRSKKEDGSYLKAILFARLGLTKLAEEEQNKLGAGNKWMAVVGPNGERALVEYDAQGLPVSGLNDSGKSLGAKELAKFGVGGGPLKGVEVEAGIFKDPTGKVAGSFVLERRPGGSVYREVGTNRIATADESKALIKTGVQGTLDTQRARLIQEINLKLQGKTQEEKMQILRPYNQQLVANGYPAVDPSEVGISAPQISGGAAAPAAETAPTAPAVPTAPAAAPGAAAPIAGPVSPTAVGGAPAPVRVGGGVAAPGTGGVVGGGIAVGRPGRPTATSMELGKAGAQAAQAANIELGKEERSNFLTYEEKEIIPKADAGGSIASTRKSQLKGPDGILANPEIVGMMSGQGGTAAEVGNIIRDLVTGARTDEELSTRVAALGLTQRQKDVLYNQIQLNRQIAPKTLKENAGAGSVSDAEQKANRDAAINIARVPLYTAVTMLSKDQFEKDQQVARQAFRNSNPSLTTVRSFNDAWGKEKSRLDAEYNQIYAARAQYIAKYYRDGANPGAIVDAYKYYPVPEFNRQTGQWDYGTDYSRKAARPKLSSFER